jgi:uncharacterized protein YggU (UPF0235/DUF167 family)
VIRLTVRAKPGVASPRIARGDDAIVVAVRERALDGLANAAVIRAVAAWLRVKPSQVGLVRGARSRTKVLAIDGLEPAGLEAALARLSEASPRPLR